MEELLKQANIPKEWWPLCKVENGIIKTPNIETLYQHGLATETQYKAWQESQKQIDICPSTKPTLDDLIAEATSNRERLDVLESAILDLIIE